MRRSKRKVNRRKLLIALVAVSVIGFLLPARVTGPLISLVQVVVPFQDWATRGANAAGGALAGDDAVVSRASLDALRRDNEALRHRLASLAASFDELERENENLAAIRRRGLVGGKLVPARVVAEDALAWRDSRLINAGTLSGVKRAAPVTSHHFTIWANQPAAVSSGQAVLAGEALVGFVEQVGTHTARIVLLTDRTTRMKAVIARAIDGQYHPVQAEFWLTGTGGETLRIGDVDHRYIRAETVQVGDVVLTTAFDTRLPAALVVGTITKIEPDRGNSLLYNLEVKPALAAGDIRDVFVVDPAVAAAP